MMFCRHTRKWPASVAHALCMVAKPVSDGQMIGLNPDAMAALTVDLLPRSAQGLAESLQFVGAMAAGTDQVLSLKFDQRMAAADDKAEEAFKQLEARINKNREVANDALNCLAVGCCQISQQHADIQKAPKNMNQDMEDARARAWTGQPQHNTIFPSICRAGAARRRDEHCGVEPRCGRTAASNCAKCLLHDRRAETPRNSSHP